MDLVVLLYNEFETLDVFGPIEVFGKLDDISAISFVSLTGGPILSCQQIPVDTSALTSAAQGADYILLIPGGPGVAAGVQDADLLRGITELAGGASYILTVCTGSALLAKTGLLDQLEATTNKRLYTWVITQGPQVLWVKKSRWVHANNIYTSSGVSAGIDMTLGFISDQYGFDIAEGIANRIEYVWTKDSEEDPFSALY